MRFAARTLLAVAALFVLVAATGGAYLVGRQTDAPIDVLCTGGFEPVEAMEELVADGVRIPAGTRLSVRRCEYADRLRLDLPLDREDSGKLQPRAAAD